MEERRYETKERKETCDKCRFGAPMAEHPVCVCLRDQTRPVLVPAVGCCVQWEGATIIVKVETYYVPDPVTRPDPMDPVVVAAPEPATPEPATPEAPDVF
jgi:hypothetical protein